MGSLHIGLILAAVIPAVILLRKVYKYDKLDKEPPGLLISLLVLGAISTFIALVVELAGDAILQIFTDESSLLYNVITYFGIVAFGEEGAKYIFLKARTWRSREFNCRFDGIVYAVFVSLGFAAWENISYVFQYGLGTAAVRAVTAVPGHASFGVMMGAFYGLARWSANQGHKVRAKLLRILAVVMAALVHGAYDFLATMSDVYGGWGFYVFIILMFVIAYVMVRRLSYQDRYI